MEVRAVQPIVRVEWRANHLPRRGKDGSAFRAECDSHAWIGLWHPLAGMARTDARAHVDSKHGGES